MKCKLSFLLIIFFSFSARADEPLDLKLFAQNYYNTMTATQAPNAGTKELEAYLALLTDADW